MTARQYRKRPTGWPTTRLRLLLIAMLVSLFMAGLVASFAAAYEEVT